MAKNLRISGNTQEKGWRKWRPYVLALLIHGVLVGLLFVGINWKSKTETQGAVTAQVWQEPAKAEPKVEPKVEPKAEPEPKPEPEVKPVSTPPPAPIKPAPEPKPKPDPAPKVAKPDLVAEKEKEKQKEKLKEQKTKEREAKEREAKERETKQREELRAKELERLSKAAESPPVPAKQTPPTAPTASSSSTVKPAATAASESAGKPDADYFGRLRSALRANTNFPNADDVTGNPSVEYAVRLRADCGIAQVRLQKSSGLPTWDAAAERAIKRTDPFPLLKDGSCPQGELVLRQRLKD